MSDRINLLKRAENVEISPLFNTYAKVILNIDDETQASAGSGAGRVLELDNPLFGSATVATKMLNRLRGYQYQPYKATGALLDPAAEIGDGISVNDVYGGLYARDRHFGHLMDADIAAPHDEELNHEYQYETPTERKLKREMGDVRATFVIQNNKIEARVAKTGGNNSSFGWVLDDSSHTWYSGNRQVMRVSASGLEISGKVTATSGYIGSASQGFAIGSRSIYNGMTSLTDTTHNGIYIGVDGIALGRGKFKVDSSGNVSATNMTLSGTLTIDGKQITAESLYTGASQAASNYGSWNGTTTTVSNNSGNWTTGANNGTSAKGKWDNALNSAIGVGTIYASGFVSSGGISASGSMSCSSISVGNSMYLGTTYITTDNGTYLVVGSRV